MSSPPHLAASTGGSGRGERCDSRSGRAAWGTRSPARSACTRGCTAPGRSAGSPSPPLGSCRRPAAAAGCPQACRACGRNEAWNGAPEVWIVHCSPSLEGYWQSWSMDLCCCAGQAAPEVCTGAPSLHKAKWKGGSVDLCCCARRTAPEVCTVHCGRLTAALRGAPWRRLCSSTAALLAKAPPMFVGNQLRSAWTPC